MICFVFSFPFFSHFQRLREELQANSLRLLLLCKQFFSRIIECRHTLPFGIRWLSRQLLVLAEERFPGQSQEKKAIILGAFLFLRMYNPAIIYPEMFVNRNRKSNSFIHFSFFFSFHFSLLFQSGMASRECM